MSSETQMERPAPPVNRLPLPSAGFRKAPPKPLPTQTQQSTIMPTTDPINKRKSEDLGPTGAEERSPKRNTEPHSEPKPEPQLELRLEHEPEPDHDSKFKTDPESESTSESAQEHELEPELESEANEDVYEGVPLSFTDRHSKAEEAKEKHMEQKW